MGGQLGREVRAGARPAGSIAHKHARTESPTLTLLPCHVREGCSHGGREQLAQHVTGDQARCQVAHIDLQ